MPTAGCLHDVTAYTSVSTPVLVGPVKQIKGDAPPMATSSLGPFQVQLSNYKISNSETNGNVTTTSTAVINNQERFDQQLRQSLQGNENNFVNIDGARVRGMLFVFGWTVEKTLINITGELAARRGAPNVTAPVDADTASPDGTDAAPQPAPNGGFEAPTDITAEAAGEVR